MTRDQLRSLAAEIGHLRVAVLQLEDSRDDARRTLQAAEHDLLTAMVQLVQLIDRYATAIAARPPDSTDRMSR